jgi:uncharacterized Zn finger protein
MARPRKPFGPNPPGRLASTMIRVLAAEMSDQSRLSRGKRYHADDAVIDIVIGHGAVTAEVRGSRFDPYVVTIEADRGSGVPSRREIWVQCTCPDDTGTGTDLCKHAVAAMFALSDEVALDPELVDRWRAGRRRPAGDGMADVTELNARRRGDVERNDDDDAGGDADDVGRDAEVIRLREPERDDGIDVLSSLLAAPAGAPTPTFPEVDPIDHRAVRDPMIRDVLDDALDHLELRWE